MQIQSTKRLKQTLTQPAEVAASVAKGEAIEIAAKAAEGAQAEAETLLKATQVSNDQTRVEFHFTVDDNDPYGMTQNAKVLTSFADVMAARATEIKKKEPEPFLDVRKTATGVVIGAPLGLGVGVIATEMGKIGQNSGNPWVSSAAIACTLIGAVGGALWANDKATFEVSGFGVKAKVG